MAQFHRDQVIRDILTSLGAPIVPVELDESAYSVIIDRTLETYSRFKPNTTHDSYQVTVPGINKHLCAENVSGVKQIEIINAINSSVISGLAIESAIISGMPVYYGTGDTFMDVQYLDLRRRWMKTVSRELGTDPDYAIVVDPDTARIAIYTFSISPIYVDADVTIPFNDDLTNIPFYSHGWIRDWALTEAQMIVGEIRSKYDKIPVAGTAMRLNGNELIARATQKQAQLLNDIQATRADLYPRWASFLLPMLLTLGVSYLC